VRCWVFWGQSSRWNEGRWVKVDVSELPATCALIRYSCRRSSSSVPASCLFQIVLHIHTTSTTATVSFYTAFVISSVRPATLRFLSSRYTYWYHASDNINSAHLSFLIVRLQDWWTYSSVESTSLLDYKVTVWYLFFPAVTQLILREPYTRTVTTYTICSWCILS